MFFAAPILLLLLSSAHWILFEPTPPFLSNEKLGSYFTLKSSYLCKSTLWTDLTQWVSHLKTIIYITDDEIKAIKEQKIFNRKISSGKYLVFLGIMNGYFGTYNFNCFKKAFLTKKILKEEYNGGAYLLSPLNNKNINSLNHFGINKKNNDIWSKNDIKVIIFLKIFNILKLIKYTWSYLCLS